MPSASSQSKELNVNRSTALQHVLLTFDDGPSHLTTPKLLDALQRTNIKAIFFILGWRIENIRARAILRRMVDEGHMLGNHSFSHIRLGTLPKHRIRDELLRTHDLIVSCANECRLFRPPYGVDNTIVNEVALELGYTTVCWNVDSLDWKLRTSFQWVPHTISQLRTSRKNVVLMHDIYANTIKHIATLIGYIQSSSALRLLSIATDHDSTLGLLASMNLGRDEQEFGDSPRIKSVYS